MIESVLQTGASGDPYTTIGWDASLTPLLPGVKQVGMSNGLGLGANGAAGGVELVFLSVPYDLLIRNT